MSDPMNNNTPFYYYSVLDVPNDAPISVIKTAYRKKALKYHPDKCKDPKAAETFKEINHAFHVLSDVDKRRCYDSFGGVERPEIPITITKPFEEFCEGIALGSFSVFANLGFVALFGTPAIGLGGWLLATQFITAFHMIPESLEEAKDYRNWSRPLGALMAPLFLITSGSCAAGYLIYNGSKMALEYSKEKLGTIGESIKKGVQTLQGRQNLSITLDDWVVLDEGKKNTRKSKSSKPETKINDRAIVLSPPVSAKRNDDVVVVPQNSRKVEEISKQVRNGESIFGWDGSVSGGVQDELSHVTKADIGVRDTKDEIDLENFHLLNSRKSNLDEAGDTDWVLLDDLL